MPKKRLNHYPLSEKAYNFLKNLDKAQKTVKIAGKVLLVCGLGLDVLELGMAIYDDLTDADRKLGKKTLSTIASIGGSWAGASIGAKLGAAAGLWTGLAAPVAIPV